MKYGIDWLTIPSVISASLVVEGHEAGGGVDRCAGLKFFGNKTVEIDLQNTGKTNEY